MGVLVAGECGQSRSTDDVKGLADRSRLQGLGWTAIRRFLALDGTRQERQAQACMEPMCVQIVSDDNAAADVHMSDIYPIRS